MKKTELIFNLLSIPVDALMLAVAGIVSFYARMHSVDLVGPVLYELQLGNFMQTIVVVIVVLLFIFALLGLYNLKGTRKFANEFGRIIVGISVGLFLVIISFFFNQNLFPSRFIILASWGFGIVFVIWGRLVLKTIQELLFKWGYGLHRLVIINGNNKESVIIQQMLNNKTYGYEVVAELDYSENTLDTLEQLYAQSRIDEIMQTNPTLYDKINLQLVEFARRKGMQFSFVPNLFEVQRNVVEVHDYKGIPVISLKNTPLDGWGKVVKRVFDIVASTACLILVAPLYALIYLAVKLDSSGPVIYPALRGGCERDFRFYKFRTMYAHMSVGIGGQDAEKLRQELWQKNDRGGADGPFLKIKNDPRITRVGRILRKTKLDEIPQFWNILKGDMSMVGPRAHVLDEVERYRNRYRRMFSIKPGAFGMSQNLQILWPDLPFDEEIRLNTYYIENWSLWLDIKILAKSFYLIFFAHKPKDNY